MKGTKLRKNIILIGASFSSFHTPWARVVPDLID